ncbi:MAG: protein kinase [Candidatus Brocadiae bacterium]|nr:protein kinase [Candidatus Brocadiia bacterium]
MTTLIACFVVLLAAVVYFFIIDPYLIVKKPWKKSTKNYSNQDLTFVLSKSEKARDIFERKAAVRKSTHQIEAIRPVSDRKESQAGLQRLDPSVRSSREVASVSQSKVVPIRSVAENSQQELWDRTEQILKQEPAKDFPQDFSAPIQDQIATQDCEKIVFENLDSPEAQNSIQTQQELTSSLPKLSIKRILAPVVVEQGQDDQAITFIVQNLENHPVSIVSSKLSFRKENIDVSKEYKIRAKIGNPKSLEAQASQEIRLSVDVLHDASLGKITLIPVLKAGWNESECEEVELLSEKPYQWRVEPAGRIFHIRTENQELETAGVPFSIQIETHLRGSLDESYHGHHRIVFSLEELSRECSAQLPEYLDLVFDQGKASTDKLFYLLNTLQSYTILAQEMKAGGAKGKSQSIKLRPAELSSFRLEIKSPQKNNSPLEGENTIIALDSYGNVKSDFKEDVMLSPSDGKIRGIPGVGNIISGASFHDGIADLTSLKAKICLTELGEAGRVVKLTAQAQSKTGQSGDICILSSIPSASSASQAMIRRLWGGRKKKIWIANTEPEIAKNFEESFQKEYEVTIKNLDPQALENLVANPPNVLFLDAGDNSQDSLLILRALRNTTHMECLPIYMIGSNDDSESKVSEILRSGCYYLTKPLNYVAIRAMVAEILQNLAVEQGNMPARGARIQGSEGLVYQIVAKIGEGGMGYIYEAKSLRDQNKVIVKYLPPRDFKNIKSVIRFVQEGYTVLNLHHENLVAGYDIFMDRNRCFYVMEFIEGKTIEQLLRMETKIATDRSVRIILQVARALEYLEQEHNLVHRDIKPSNILVTQQGLVKLVDFGIAKLSNHHLTTVGIILGTPYYLSPEQILGKEITIQSDIYSLGATFYHMVTGTHPFQGPDVYNIIHQRLSKDPREPHLLNPEIPIGVSHLIMKMLDRKPTKRHETAKALVKEIESIIDHLDSGIWEEDLVL